MSQSLSLVFAPSRLQWWQWGKLFGAVGLVTLLCWMAASGALPHPLVLGVVAHLVCDFSLQSDWIAAEKSKRGKALLYHALIAGGLPGALVGLYAGPPACLLAILIGVVSHYAIDYTRKFGCKSVATGATLDQVAHIIVLILW